MPAKPKEKPETFESLGKKLEKATKKLGTKKGSKDEVLKIIASMQIALKEKRIYND